MRGRNSEMVTVFSFDNLSIEQINWMVESFKRIKGGEQISPDEYVAIFDERYGGEWVSEWMQEGIKRSHIRQTFKHLKGIMAEYKERFPAALVKYKMDGRNTVRVFCGYDGSCIHILLPPINHDNVIYEGMQWVINVEDRDIICGLKSSNNPKDAKYTRTRHDIGAYFCTDINPIIGNHIESGRYSKALGDAIGATAYDNDFFSVHPTSTCTFCDDKATTQCAYCRTRLCRKHAHKCPGCTYAYCGTHSQKVPKYNNPNEYEIICINCDPEIECSDPECKKLGRKNTFVPCTAYRHGMFCDRHHRICISCRQRVCDKHKHHVNINEDVRRGANYLGEKNYGSSVCNKCDPPNGLFCHNPNCKEKPYLRKQVREFNPDKRTKTGYNLLCKECQRQKYHYGIRIETVTDEQILIARGENPKAKRS